MVSEEIKLENQLIDQLCHGASQWTYREDLKTEADLWDNLRTILNRNNKAILDGVPLTDAEFKQVQNTLSFNSFYAAATSIRGENGIMKVEVRREDASLGTVRLHVLNNNDIAGGMSVYEVVNQVRHEDDHKDRRLDVTLLINGLPLIHIELKSRSVGYMKAFNQIEKYIKEGRFQGIYSTVQMFVVSNGVNTRYIAPHHKGMNTKFLSRWVDADNQAVEELIPFADSVLSIPEAHLMVADYTVLDKESKALILMRPYQIHAINAVKKASRNQQSGYVWHTTGSGKTLTSYKVAKNLLKIPRLDKTVFVVDRVDLDQQTTSSFLNYSENDVVEIDETDNVRDLINKLESKDRQVIITTIQKFNTVIRRADEFSDQRLEYLRNLNLAFIVDECHRAVSPEKHQLINQFFRNALWYGFTGTPRFAENAYEAQGDLARTTEELYGPRLHEYTVKEAIFDKSVLGFQMEYRTTISDNELRMQLAKLYGDDVYQWSADELEENIPTDFFGDQHRLSVIDGIINDSGNKFALHNGPGKTFGALLTTASIPDAKRYYSLFKQVKNDQAPVLINERVKTMVNDFPKVGITYSLSENEDRSLEDQEFMADILKDYNEMFGTQFTLGTIKAYNRDLNNRLARKKEKYKARSEQLDIVIVVDRLLTGFDAPSLGILFIDRDPMKPHMLIQSFSRTNRLFNTEKQFGQIVSYRLPSLFQKAVAEALLLYSNGGETELLAPTWEESKANFVAAVQNLREIALTPEATNDFTSEEQKIQFAKAYQELDRTFAAVRVYGEFDLEQIKRDYGISQEEMKDYEGHYKNIIEELKEDVDDEETLAFDIEYRLQTMQTDQIDYDYIVNMLQQMVPEDGVDQEDKAEVDDEEIRKLIAKYHDSHPERAAILEMLFEELRNTNDIEHYRNMDVRSVIEQRINAIVEEKLHGYAYRQGLNHEDLEYYVNSYNPMRDEKDQPGRANLMSTADVDKYRERNQSDINKLKYKRLIKDDLKNFITEEILPYQEDDY